MSIRKPHVAAKKPMNMCPQKSLRNSGAKH